jgi:hypothetical protein
MLLLPPFHVGDQYDGAASLPLMSMSMADGILQFFVCVY